MQISDRSILETIESIVCEFRRFSSPESGKSIGAIKHMRDVSVGKLYGIQRLLSSIKYSRVIDEEIEHLSEICDLAENRISTQKEATAVEREAFLNSGDSARLPAGAPVLANAGNNQYQGDLVANAGQGGN